ERRSLRALGLEIARLRSPRGMSEIRARQLLLDRFPGLVADYNDLFQPQGTLSLPAPDYARRLIAWGRPSVSCGRGRTIGVIDTAVDNSLPALAGVRLSQRSFVPADRMAANPDHGTAVAALLAGQPAAKESGLLPGVELRVAQIFARDVYDRGLRDSVPLAADLSLFAAP